MPLTKITGNVVQDASLPESKLINPYVNVSGDTMTGSLILPTNGLVVGGNQLIVSGGNIGVNTLSPQYTLDVVGSLRVTGQIFNTATVSVTKVSLSSDGSLGSPAIYFNNENNTGIYRSSSGTISFTSTGNTSANLSYSGLKIFGGVLSVNRTSSVSSTDNVIEYESGIDTYHFGRDTSSINFRTSNVSNRIRINSIGQVSIGTASTISGILLNVAGRVNSSSGYNGILLSDLPTVTTAYGGTGLTSYSAGDLLYYSSGNTFSKLSAPVVESILISDENGFPSWTPRPLAVTHGGTGLTISPNSGQILIGTGNSFVLNTISAGTGITVVNGSGTIGIGATNIPNSSLSNSAITINTGTGLSGGKIVSLGEAITLENIGVTSLSAGTGINVSNTTGSVTVTNSGVTSAVAGSGINISSSTGDVTYSLDPNYAPTFSGLTLNTALNVTSGGTGNTVAPSANQILYGNNSGGYSRLSVIGVGITITPDYNNNTLTLTTDLTGASVSILSNGNSNLSIPQANGSIVATTANSEILRITPSQYVGIGTTTPSCKLDFGSSALGNGKIIGFFTNSTLGQFVGLGLSPSNAAVRIGGTPISVASNAEVASLGYYSTDSFYNYTSVVYVSNNNRVGINNTSPAYTLDITGDVRISGNLLFTNTSQTISDTTTAGTGQVTIDSFSITSYRSGKYIVQIQNTDNNYYQLTELLLIQDGTNVYLTEYGTLNSSGSLGVIDANISGGNVNLTFTPTYPNNKVRVQRSLISVFN